MAPSAEQLQGYLAPAERLVAVFDATLHETGTRRPVSVGITDRRLLCVAEDGRFVTVGYDSLCTVQRRAWTTRTVQGRDYRLLLAGGGLLTVFGGVGVVALATTLVVPLLTLTAVGGVVSAAFLQRDGTDSMWNPAAGVGKPTLSASSPDPSTGESGPASPRLVLTGSAVLAVTSLASIILVASGGLVVAATLAVLGGTGIAEYAYRHRGDFDGMELIRRREAELRVSTDDGRTLRVRNDSCEELSRELSRMAYADVGHAGPA